MLRLILKKNILNIYQLWVNILDICDYALGVTKKI
jgi:hypothetical protein